MLLPVTVAAPDSLFNTLRVPRQVVVDDQRAELEVDAPGSGFRRDHDDGFISEVFDQSRSHISRRRTTDPVSAFVLLQPALVNLLAFGIVVGAVEKHDSAFVQWGLFENGAQVFLSSGRFGKDYGFLSAALLRGFRQSPLQSGQEPFPLSILQDRLG